MYGSDSRGDLDLRSAYTCVRDCVYVCSHASQHIVCLPHPFPSEQEAHPRCKSGMSASLSTQILGSPLAAEWSGANKNSFLRIPRLIHPVSSRLSFPHGIYHPLVGQMARHRSEAILL